VRLLLERRRDELQRQVAGAEARAASVADALAEARAEVEHMGARLAMEQGRFAGAWARRWCISAARVVCARGAETRRVLCATPHKRRTRGRHAHPSAHTTELEGLLAAQRAQVYAADMAATAVTSPGGAGGGAEAAGAGVGAAPASASSQLGAVAARNKALEGQVGQLQQQVAALQAAREAQDRELARLTAQAVALAARTAAAKAAAPATGAGGSSSSDGGSRAGSTGGGGVGQPQPELSLLQGQVGHLQADLSAAHADRQRLHAQLAALAAGGGGSSEVRGWRGCAGGEGARAATAAVTARCCCGAPCRQRSTACPCTPWRAACSQQSSPGSGGELRLAPELSQQLAAAQARIGQLQQQLGE
jgi:cell division septum initiation protein DivIVA